MHRVQSREVQIATVYDVESSDLKGQDIEHVDITHLSITDVNEAGSTVPRKSNNVCRLMALAPSVTSMLRRDSRQVNVHKP